MKNRYFWRKNRRAKVGKNRRLEVEGGRKWAGMQWKAMESSHKRLLEGIRRQEERHRTFVWVCESRKRRKSTFQCKMTLARFGDFMAPKVV